MMEELEMMEEMEFRNDGSGEIGDNAFYALSISEIKQELEEARSFTSNCVNKITDEKKKFADKSALGLWWDAKGLFNRSDVTHVTDHMEQYERFYKEIDTLSEKVERGDTSDYKRLLDINTKLQTMEMDAHHDVKNNRSSAVRKMSREFLDKKCKLAGHNLKKVECVVLKQKLSEFEKSFTPVSQMIEEMGGVEEFKETLRKIKEEKASEADERSEAIRPGSSKKEETEERSEARLRELEKQNVEMRSEAESDEKLKRMLKEAETRAEARAEARLRELKKENEKLKLEAEKIRRESDEKLIQAVEEANRRSEARMQEMAEQNRVLLQNMVRMLEAAELP